MQTIQEVLEEENLVIEMESRISEDLGLNSYRFMSLISDLEDEFDVEMEEKEILKLKTIAQLIAYVKKCCNE